MRQRWDPEIATTREPQSGGIERAARLAFPRRCYRLRPCRCTHIHPDVDVMLASIHDPRGVMLMKYAVVALIVVALATPGLAADSGEGRMTSAMMASSDPGVRAEKAIPRVAKNQVRPSFETQEQDLDVEGGGGGYTSACVKKSYCTGGSICATGNCSASETATGCAYCTGFKCKNRRCD